VRNLKARNLKELRESRGMSQHDVAVKLDVTDVAISRWECGRANPLRKYRERMASVYGVSVDVVNELLKPDEGKV